jgi:hypothetical protein
MHMGYIDGYSIHHFRSFKGRIVLIQYLGYWSCQHHEVTQLKAFFMGGRPIFLDRDVLLQQIRLVYMYRDRHENALRSAVANLKNN